MSGFQAAIAAAIFLAAQAVNVFADERVETGECTPKTSSLGHNRFGVSGNTENDAHFCFVAFESSFDGDDSDDDDKDTDYLAVPQWVAQRIDKSEIGLESGSRPSKWFTDEVLHHKGWAPGDDSYRYSKTFLASHPDWYQRGHLAQKYLAERLGNDAAYNTHTVLNAVPQRARFNAGIWLDLECKTGAWANRYGSVWVVTGPIFLLGRPNAWIGEDDKEEILVGVPDALFKVVIRQDSGERLPRTLAFIYTQDNPSYAKGPYNHSKWLTSISRIEALTGLTFFTPGSMEPDVPNFSAAEREELVSARAEGVWPYEDSDFDRGCSKNKQ